MVREIAENFRPVAPPQLIDNAYSDDQHARLLGVVREHGPWKLIMAANFSTPSTSSVVKGNEPLSASASCA